MTSSCFNFAAFAYGVKVALQHISHIPTITNALLDTGQAILTAEIEKARVLVLCFWPGELLDDAVVHDEELLFLRVRKSWGPRGLPR
jgi:hypothetical protein